ncbi:E3 ubiquitin-protein ligase RNF213 isoform X2 [Rhinatrema bivittatum]|uniref:E3 ubiquitin-protein ligase RNF213 isoform X2 n=1 Tax=Rhinatrema bivittatum TaxID=194408 RepID=UPI00112E60D2|nr:E3 ubiquitin-protein ligase RNF213 isoform X2 [Rhinatrema bivittatum]
MTENEGRKFTSNLEAEMEPGGELRVEEVPSSPSQGSKGPATEGQMRPPGEEDPTSPLDNLSGNFQKKKKRRRKKKSQTKHEQMDSLLPNSDLDSLDSVSGSTGAKQHRGEPVSCQEKVVAPDTDLYTDTVCCLESMAIPDTDTPTVAGAVLSTVTSVGAVSCQENAAALDTDTSTGAVSCLENVGTLDTDMSTGGKDNHGKNDLMEVEVSLTSADTSLPGQIPSNQLDKISGHDQVAGSQSIEHQSARPLSEASSNVDISQGSHFPIQEEGECQNTAGNHLSSLTEVGREGRAGDTSQLKDSTAPQKENRSQVNHRVTREDQKPGKKKNGSATETAASAKEKEIAAKGGKAVPPESHSSTEVPGTKTEDQSEKAQKDQEESEKKQRKEEREFESKQQANTSGTKKKDKSGNQEASTEGPGKGTPGKQKDKIQQKQRPNRSVNAADQVTVYFHAIISKDFNLDPEKQKVVIRAGKMKEYEDWKEDVCEMSISRDLGDHGFLLEGYTVISKENLNTSIPYKYCVRGTKKFVYEFIYKPDVTDGINVNRCLFIKRDCLDDGGWHQYDDIICARPDSGYLQRFKKMFGWDDKKKDLFRGKQIAGKIMLENIFSIPATWSTINLRSFLNQLCQFYIVTSKPMVFENQALEWKSLQFGPEQVNELIINSMNNLARPFLDKKLTDVAAETAVVKSKLRTGIILLVIGEYFKLPTSKEQLTQLCDLLCLEKMSQEAFLQEIGSMKETCSFLPMEQNLKHLCQRCMEEYVNSWVLIIPLLHEFSSAFSSGDSSSLGVSLKSEDCWAGLVGIPFDDLRKKHFYKNAMLSLMKSKKHLLEMDKTLVRSWFCLLPQKDLVDFLTEMPMDLSDVLQGTYYRLQENNMSYGDFEMVETLLKKVLNVMDKNQNRTLQSGKFCLNISFKLHEMICEKTKSLNFSEIPALSANVILKVNMLQEMREIPGKEVESKASTIEDILQKSLKVTKDWFRTVFRTTLPQYPPSLYEELQVWNRFVTLSFHSEQQAEYWRNSLQSDLIGRIKQETPFNQIEVYCRCHDTLEKFHTSIAKCFERCAVEAVHSACQSQNSILSKLSRYNIERFGKLVSVIITNSWPSNRTGERLDSFDRVLQHLLEWPDVQHIFKLYGSDGEILAQLTEDARNLMAIADSVFQETTESLMRGTLLVKHLECIVRNREQFQCIWDLKQKNLSAPEKKEKRDDLEQVLTWRETELKQLKMEREWVDSLLKMCSSLAEFLKVETDDLQEKQRVDLSVKPLDEVVNVMHLDSFLHEHPTVIHFDLSQKVKDMAKQIHTFRQSHIFQLCWEREARSKLEEIEDIYEGIQKKELNLEELEQELFCTCVRKYEALYEDLKSGRLTFAVVDDIFRDYKDRYEELRKDFQIMSQLQAGNQREWIDSRLLQIQQYHQLHLAIDSAKVIAQVRDDFRLSGNFNILQTFLHFADDFEFFKQQSLSCINDELMQTKQELLEISEMRQRCLKEVTRRKDFIVWVTDALRDVNELKVFVDLASISAGENDMDVDRVACFHDAILGYSSLLYELKTDMGFAGLMHCLQKLWKALDSDEKLPKKLMDSARHLEWLKTVKESHGSVELSSLSLATAINRKGIYIIGAPAEGQKVTPDSVLRLNLPESHDGEEEVRLYSLEDLKELQNKLMLMSGRGEQGSMEVETFSEVFSNVQRLTSSFINLHSAGNLLFRHWKAKVYCSSESWIGIHMDFQLAAVGAIDGQGSVVHLLPALCKEMELLLERWKEYMDRMRSQHYYLNYYTAEQLVYLCQRLAHTHVIEDAMTMLSFINSNSAHVQSSLNELKRMSQLWPRLSWDEGSTVSQSNVSLLHANAAELPSMSCAEMTRQLEELWASYMENMSSFMPGSLDINTLGNCLAFLAETEQKTVNRTLPPSLLPGNPNLILCPPLEILPSALAIYMHSPDQPLPTYDEVLLCTPQTTFEPVELFLRRCLTPGSKEKKVYTLLHADELVFEVGLKAEQLFRRLEAQCKEPYQLVMLCNCNQEHYYIPSVFSQHKVHIIPQEPPERIQKYLQKHFTVPRGILSAASVFKDGTCVGIVSSKRAGVGKSLYVKKLQKKLTRGSYKVTQLKTIRLIDPQVDESKVLRRLLPFLRKQYERAPMIFHFDITSSVQSGISEFLFKLLVLQYLMDNDGKMWKRNPHHLYLIEILEGSAVAPKKPIKQVSRGPQYSFLDLFPKVICRAPKEVLEREMQSHGPQHSTDPGMDHEEFCSEAFQRPFQYLTRFRQNENLDSFCYIPGSIEGSPVECLQLLLIYCGIMDPSWSELRNFTWFLNLQLRDCESSLFCNVLFVGDVLHGFKTFVVKFMILMAKDFATPSLNISDQSLGNTAPINLDDIKEEDIAPFLLRKKWETEPHPYIFFNDDHESMTFIGFHLQPNGISGGVDAINSVNGKIIESNVMTMQLYQGLQLQRVPFNIDFDALSRDQKIEKLCLVLGIQWPLDPDESYELTMDNMLKILAIKMRFRCGIPVIIMGETGCGKTRLIKFMCDLHRSGAVIDNLKLVKVHGGTSAKMIYDKIREAEAIAVVNKLQYQFDTVLFFDEANTTEAVSSIKEALCDRTVEGVPLAGETGLQIIAACNPYRKHTNDMIKRLESAGLGYRVKADETKEKLGSIPLRQLVYRVHSLPPSMIPLVWDFGQLNNNAEKKYIQQIVQKLVESIQLSSGKIELLTNVLSASQCFMRRRHDECSFVSLRDVERCMEVFKWFYSRSELLWINLEKYLMEHKIRKYSMPTDNVAWSLVLAIGICYHASLDSKDAYRNTVSKELPDPYTNPKKILQDITIMQDLFLSGVNLRETIARNLALKENVFMMVICIDLKIPLFLVGKPGSSKSLAKTIVADAMQGQAAHSDLYKKLKQIHLVSFQCSPHSTPEGIIGTFKHCARFQEGKNLKDYVSVVVLDEIGLAEDSPKMPLKTLHPLLEDGCVDDDPLPHKKVGFIGISNWALDPAKMNRGIFVSRGDPKKGELIESAKGICSSDSNLLLQKIQNYFPIFADVYTDICKMQKLKDKEFFGLRDYYSLIKMVFALTRSCKKEPSNHDIVQVILRNFSGKDDINAVEIFISKITNEKYTADVDTIDLVRQNIYSDGQDECRYLLILTKNYAALQILQQVFFAASKQPEVIFGSSFPKDQEYTQICRNINRVKICMETGQMVVLLNLQNLYESLYDALNQYYVYLAGQKYVDLGLGTHRVKCRVHDQFRLIVIEEKDIVYTRFPIPLINRLEKHYLDINTVLNKQQKAIVQDLEKWVKDFTTVNTESMLVGQKTYSPFDVFIGYHEDTCASVILQVTEKLKHDCTTETFRANVIEQARLALLNCATPDSVIRLGSSQLGPYMAEQLVRKYFRKQKHNSLVEFLHSHTQIGSGCCTIFTEITTFSRLLTAADRGSLEEQVKDRVQRIEVLSLQQFDTEHAFLKEIRNFMEGNVGNKVLIIQNEFEDGCQSAHLIASAKYSAVNEINKVKLNEVSVFVYFITKLPRMEGGTSYVGFHGGLWQSVHIDDLRRPKDMVSDVTALRSLTISQLFYEKEIPKYMAVEKKAVMDRKVEESKMKAGSQEEHRMEVKTLKETRMEKTKMEAESKKEAIREAEMENEEEAVTQEMAEREEAARPQDESKGEAEMEESEEEVGLQDESEGEAEMEESEEEVGLQDESEGEAEMEESEEEVGLQDESEGEAEMEESEEEAGLQDESEGEAEMEESEEEAGLQDEGEAEMEESEEEAGLQDESEGEAEMEESEEDESEEAAKIKEREEEVGSQEEVQAKEHEIEANSEEEENEAEEKDVLDTTTLIRSCVQSAVGMLRDQNEVPTRSTRRIEILLSLLTREEELKEAFLKMLRYRLHDLLKKQEENSYNAKEWVVREASNSDALQEAGTFRHTLWKRIQTTVTPFLAHLVSILDRDGNLELLVGASMKRCVKDLWMFIFMDMKLLSVPYVKSNSWQNETILVQNYMKLSGSVYNEMPFSWRIKDYLEEIWIQAQYIQNMAGHEEKFIDIFQQTPLGQFISSLHEEDRRELFLRYVHDFLLLSMSISSLGELQFLQMALLSCVEELRREEKEEEEEVPLLPWVHIGYHQFRHRLQNFSRILAVCPHVLESLTLRIEEVLALRQHEMALDVFAAVAGTELLETRALQPTPEAWLRQVKNLQMPIELICSESYTQGRAQGCQLWLQEVKARWNRVFSMALFVEHVVLGVGTRNQTLYILVEQDTIKLGKVLEADADMKMLRPFRVVIDVLRDCRDRANRVFCRRGLQDCSICLSDLKEPVCLPCDHTYCKACIGRWLIPGQMICPYCKTVLPDNFNITVSKGLSAALEKYSHFRKLCNNFFIDLVSSVCFKGSVPPDKPVILLLLSLLFFNKELCQALQRNRTSHTKSLSPFDDSVDKSPVVRSVVLKLLLKYSFEDVKEYIQTYLSDIENPTLLDQEDLTEVYMLFVNCLEDSMYEKIGAFTKTQLREDGLFLKNCHQDMQKLAPRESSIEYLQGMARIRLCLDTAAQLIFEMYGETGTACDSEKRHYLQQVEAFCTSSTNDWHLVYLVRKLTDKHSLNFVQTLCKDGSYHWLFPQEIVQQQMEQMCHVDLFLVCGEEYRALRDALCTAILECKMESIVKAQKKCKTSAVEHSVYLLLAIFRELTMLYGSQNANMHPKPVQCETVSNFIQNTRAFKSDAVVKFAESLVTNSHPALRVSPENSSFRGTVTEILIHTAAVLVCGQNRILDPLRNLAFFPAKMENSFLPTMPEDLLPQAKAWQGLENLHWYLCPNGHYCTIGECGAPMEVARCVDCGAAIGGQQHKSLAGFQMIQGQHVDRTETGHVLKDSSAREAVVAPDRDLPPASFVLLRLLMHLAMLLGADSDKNSMLKIIKPQVQDPETFLLSHIRKDMEQLRSTLGKSADETTLVIHLVLCSLLKDPQQQPNQWPVRFDSELSSKDSRNAWERCVANTVIAPEMQHLDKKLLEVTARISQDERIGSSPVVKMVYGDPMTFLSELPKGSRVHCSRLWSCRKRISIEHLRHVMQQQDGKDTVPVLWKFLQKEAELRQVKFLPEILALQRDLVKRFQHFTDLEKQKIEDFLESLHSDGMRQAFRRRVEIFICTWNQLRTSLQTSGDIKLPEGICDQTLSLKSDLEILLPRRRGLGLCATALVSYLINMHNEFVYLVEKDTKEAQQYSISPSEVADLHMISYEVEKDIIPLILSNCQYSVVSGGQTLEEFDLEKIQRQVTSRFLQGKPLITSVGIPTLVYRQDRNYENIFSDVKGKLQQNSLPNSMINMMSGELHSYSEVCEALSVAEVALGFLAMTGGESDMPLVTYLKDVLQMRDQMSTHVVQVLSRCHLKHVIALWQFLSAQKSEHLLRLKRNPFEEVEPAYQKKLSRESWRLLNAFLAQVGLETFLLELHELIFLKLKTPRATMDFNPSWSLRDTLTSFIERKGVDVLPELEELFPEQILLSHCVEAWKAAAALRRDRVLR